MFVEVEISLVIDIPGGLWWRSKHIMMGPKSCWDLRQRESRDQKAKQGAESSQPEVPLTLKRAKSICPHILTDVTVTTPKPKSLGKPWETGHCGSNPETPGESRDCCPLLPNHRA
ncbi:hypothetical protein TNCV_3593331 [Trichonephila clavipes]|nr:hypothetical protein TNCV_3593331 [Trichonephila clavipes]